MIFLAGNKDSKKLHFLSFCPSIFEVFITFETQKKYNEDYFL